MKTNYTIGKTKKRRKKKKPDSEETEHPTVNKDTITSKPEEKVAGKSQLSYIIHERKPKPRVRV